MKKIVKLLFVLIVVLFMTSCKTEKKENAWKAYNSTSELKEDFFPTLIKGNHLYKWQKKSGTKPLYDYVYYVGTYDGGYLFVNISIFDYRCKPNIYCKFNINEIEIEYPQDL